MGLGCCSRGELSFGDAVPGRTALKVLLRRDLEMGRRKGARNKPGHKAGGKRAGSGRQGRSAPPGTPSIRSFFGSGSSEAGAADVEGMDRRGEERGFADATAAAAGDAMNRRAQECASAVATEVAAGNAMNRRAEECGSAVGTAAVPGEVMDRRAGECGSAVAKAAAAEGARDRRVEECGFAVSAEAAVEGARDRRAEECGLPVARAAAAGDAVDRRAEKCGYAFATAAAAGEAGEDHAEECGFAFAEGVADGDAMNRRAEECGSAVEAAAVAGEARDSRAEEHGFPVVVAAAAEEARDRRAEERGSAFTAVAVAGDAMVRRAEEGGFGVTATAAAGEAMNRRAEKCGYGVAAAAASAMGRDHRAEKCASGVVAAAAARGTRECRTEVCGSAVATATAAGEARERCAEERGSAIAATAAAREVRGGRTIRPGSTTAPIVTPMKLAVVGGYARGDRDEDHGLAVGLGGAPTPSLSVRRDPSDDREESAAASEVEIGVLGSRNCSTEGACFRGALGVGPANKTNAEDDACGCQPARFSEVVARDELLGGITGRRSLQAYPHDPLDTFEAPGNGNDDLSDGDDEEGDDEDCEIVRQGAVSQYVTGVLRGVVEESKRFGKPKCYQTGCLWIDPQDPATLTPTAAALRPGAYCRPRIFVWDPMALKPTLVLHCVQEGCNGHLVSKGYSDTPRSVAHWDQTVYVIVKRYNCTKCGKSARAYATSVLEQLPLRLQMMFPFTLTKRFGVTKQLLNWMRFNVVNGIGFEKCAEFLLEAQARRREELELAFLSSLKDALVETKSGNVRGSTLLALCGVKADDLPSFPSLGSADYPFRKVSSNFLRSVYKAEMKRLSVRMDQEVTRHTGRTVKGDHSHKLRKRLCRTEEGVNNVEATYTFLNEKELIVHQIHVLNTGTAQLQDALKEVEARRQAFGHEEVEFAYSDICCNDTAMFEEAFPSLRRPLPPARWEAPTKPVGMAADHQVETTAPNISADRQLAPSECPDASLPSDWAISLVATSAHAAEVCEVIVNHAEAARTTGSVIPLGLDAEWDTASMVDGNFVRGPGPLAVLQISWSKMRTVYIFQLSVIATAFLGSGRLSLASQISPFAELLSHRGVVFIGRNVGGDLSKLKRDWDIGGAASQRLELGIFSRERGLVESGSVGLASLAKAALGLRLRKDTGARLSVWSSKKLSDMQREYAAVDAWVSLRIFERLHSIPGRVPTKCEPGRQVEILGRDGSMVVARGLFARSDEADPSGVTLQIRGKELRGLVRVLEVLAPAAIVEFPNAYSVLGKTYGERKRTAGSQFLVVCSFFTLLYAVEHDLSDPEEQRRSVPREDTAKSHVLPCNEETESVDVDFLPGLLSEEAAQAAVIADSGSESHDVPALAITRECTSDDVVCEKHDTDDAGATDRCHVETDFLFHDDDGNFPFNDNGDSADVWKRVLGDIFHFMRRIPLPKTHGWSLYFSKTLSHAFFLYNRDDIDCVEEWLRLSGRADHFVDFLQKEKVLALQLVRRFVPSPSLLVERVASVVEFFKHRICAKTNVRLLSDDAIQKYRSLLTHLRSGCASDHPSHPIYRPRGIHKPSRLPLWRCCRGTSDIEGACHMPMARILTSSNSGPEISNFILTEWRLRYNVNRHAETTIGMRKLGHPDVWIRDNVLFHQEAVYGKRRCDLEWTSLHDYDVPVYRYGLRPVGGNGILFEQLTLEALVDQKGIVEKLADLCTPGQKFLTEALDLPYPAQAVSTAMEMKLFRQTHSLLLSRGQLPGGRIKPSVIQLQTMTRVYNKRVAELWLSGEASGGTAGKVTSSDIANMDRASFGAGSRKKKKMAPRLLFKTLDHIRCHYNGAFKRAQNSRLSVGSSANDTKRLKAIMFGKMKIPAGISLSAKTATAPPPKMPKSLQRAPIVAKEVDADSAAPVANSERPAIALTLAPAPQPSIAAVGVSVPPVVFPSEFLSLPQWQPPLSLLPTTTQTVSALPMPLPIAVPPSTLPAVTAHPTIPAAMHPTPPSLLAVMARPSPAYEPVPKRQRQSRSCKLCGSSDCPAAASRSKLPCTNSRFGDLGA